MINTILEAIRYTLTLLFGIFVSTLFLDIKINKKNILIIFGFFYIDLALQAIFQVLFLFILLLRIYHYFYSLFLFLRKEFFQL